MWHAAETLRSSDIRLCPEASAANRVYDNRRNVHWRPLGSHEKGVAMSQTRSHQAARGIWSGLTQGVEDRPEVATVGVLGVPFDGGVSFRSGAAAAPARLRAWAVSRSQFRPNPVRTRARISLISDLQMVYARPASGCRGRCRSPRAVCARRFPGAGWPPPVRCRHRADRRTGARRPRAVPAQQRR